MGHVVTRRTPPRPILGGRGVVHQVPLGGDNLGWLIACAETGTCAAVDGPEAGPVLEACEHLDLRLVAVLNTHTHADHIGLNRDLHGRGRLSSLRVFGSALRRDEVPGLTDPVGQGDRVTVGRLEGEVWLTEGHVDGHISFLFGEALFCGDTLFGAGCGYLFDGPASAMFASLQALAALPDETLVCCAHEYTEDNLRFAWSLEPDNQALADRIRRTLSIRSNGGSTVPSTMAEERATNPFLRPHSASLREHVCAAMGLDSDIDACTLFAATRALKDRKDYRDLDDADLPH